MEVFQQAVAVVAVLGLLAATLWWLRRRGLAGVVPGRKPGGRRLEALERLSLGPQQTLHLVRVGETALLLASSPAGCTLMQSFPSSQIESCPCRPAATGKEARQ
jgi:flagellar biosynthetic protein FliO